MWLCGKIDLVMAPPSSNHKMAKQASTGKRWTKALIQQLQTHVDDGVTQVAQLKEFFPQFTDRQVTAQLQKLKNAGKAKLPIPSNSLKAFHTPVKTPMSKALFGKLYSFDNLANITGSPQASEPHEDLLEQLEKM
jgi:hypothetical protein